MSHISLTRVRIKNLNKNILKIALQLMEKHGIIVLLDEPIDMRLKNMKADFYINYMGRDIAIIMKENEIELHADWFYINEEEVKKKIQEYYKAGAVLVSLRKAGHNILSVRCVT